ncbi:hypothetical protein X946_5555 [Burkholderia sp. ABCPW 111]|nr:hypothetical protein X946_5555 [Burkholderia sp. ABCPW 111]
MQRDRNTDMQDPCFHALWSTSCSHFRVLYH